MALLQIFLNLTIQSQSSAGKKKVRREPKIEAIPEEASRPEAGFESILSSGEETDEKDELFPSIALHSRSLYTRGPAVTSVEDVSPIEEETKEVATKLADPLE